MDENDGKLEVTLLGDSTLDNIVWVANTEEAVPAQLKERLGEQAVVINFAADGFNTKDMLEGQVPSISYAARLHADPFPIDEGDAFYPLIFIQGSASTHAVLSVGGNDVREILGRMDLLQERIMQFMINYPIIVSQIVSQIPKLTICLQYRPSVLDSPYGVYQAMAAVPGPGSAVQKLNKLMETVFPVIFQAARQHGLPIVDLARSFDINDSSLYVSQIEPSAEGSKLIAGLLSHVIKHHDFAAEPSTFYFKPPGTDEIVSQVNDGSFEWKVDDP